MWLKDRKIYKTIRIIAFYEEKFKFGGKIAH